MIKINNNVKKIMNLVESNGYEIYIVGGYVRDSIIDRENKDIDLCTNMSFDELKKILPYIRIMKENDHRNTGIIRCGEDDIEISTFRGNNLIDDLSCRDFTMNSIALNSDGEIIDPLNGINDIKNKIIRLSDRSGESLRIDPLRILRCIRFSGMLGYEVDEDTLNHMLDKKVLLKNVAVERLYNELSKIILCNMSGNLISKFREIICEVIPELKSMIGFQQQNPYHMYDVFEHSMIVLNNTSNNLKLRFAALFHDIGKPYCFSVDENGIGHFYQHSKFSGEIFTNFAKRMKMDNDSIIYIQKLIYFHDIPLDSKIKNMNRFIREFGEKNINLLFELKIADISGQNNDKIARVDEIKKLREIYIDYLNSKPVLTIKDLKINGYVLQKMGYEGKIIGTILNDILNIVGNGDLINDENSIVQYVSRKY